VAKSWAEEIQKTHIQTDIRSTGEYRTGAVLRKNHFREKSWQVLPGVQGLLGSGKDMGPLSALMGTLLPGGGESGKGGNFSVVGGSQGGLGKPAKESYGFPPVRSQIYASPLGRDFRDKESVGRDPEYRL